MKVLFTGLFAANLFLSLAANGQTLATPPAATKAPATTPAKPVKNKLEEKVNAIIKKQTPAAAPAAKPVAASSAPSAATQPKPANASATTQAKPAAPVVRPESKVERLITEREQLVLKYDYLKTQGSNFWGKASKEDMRAVIEALKEVLQKDEKIIHAVEQANLETRRSVAQRAAQFEAETKKLNNQVQGDKRVVTDNIYDLKTSLNNARNLAKRKDRAIKDLEEQVQTAKDAKFEHDAIAAFFAMFSLLLVGYIVRLRGQIGKPHQKKHAKA
ncbi:hypothetical protein TH63_06955 [Rufibacter radiotolerans]|uniref:Uncharacterized protein n=1 Tax=Rufibacter radiotolerans TaxID=1379910 RepID=A0A0H4VNJ3_9BACT|nr:hypothetical protein [Rufibacter radiotolerans]AKQ45437.1 hypothetical protein TH63_06955 [Rufibacter radiotolerans]